MHIPSKVYATTISTMICVLTCVSVSAEQSIKVWTAPAMTRVMLTQAAPDITSDEITLHMCRNEWESAQVIISGKADFLSQLHYRIEILSSENDTKFLTPTIYQEFDIPVIKSSPRAPEKAQWYPDALVPFANGSKPALASFRNQPGVVNLRLWLDFHSPENQQPGSYVARLLVTDPADKSLIEEARIAVTVLPESLPNKPSLKSYFGLEEHRIARIHGLDRNKNGSELALVMDSYYQLLADSRLQPGLIFASSPPLDENNQLVWDRPASDTLPAPEKIVKKYCGSEGRFNSFHLPMWRDYPFADPLASNRAQAIAYLAELANLAHRTAPDADLFFSVGQLDEPDTAEAYQKIRAWSALVREAAVMAETPIKFFVTEQPQSQESEWGTLIGAVDIWAPHVMWAWEDLESKSGKRLIQERIKAGEEVWCYPALAQFRDQWKQEKGLPDMAGDSYPPVWLTDYPAVQYRILPWICAAHGMTGIHYWNTFEWPNDIDPWENAGSFIIDEETFNGDGLLIYPPAPARLVGKEKAAAMKPCPSIRLKWIRDGMEDYEHLQLLRKKNPVVAKAIRDRIARGFADWQTSPDKINTARIMISNTLNR